MDFFMQYDVIIIGAGPGGIFSAYELSKLCPEKKIAVFEEGQPLEKRRCPIDGKNVRHCIGCPTCAIMNGFGGAGAFSDGKYNLTNDFGGTLYDRIEGHQLAAGDMVHATRAEGVIARLLGETPAVTSNHHQAVHRLGAGLSVGNGRGTALSRVYATPRCPYWRCSGIRSACAPARLSRRRTAPTRLRPQRAAMSTPSPSG